MSKKLDQARQLLTSRLHELDRERTQLQAALAQLDGVGSNGPEANHQGNGPVPSSELSAAGPRSQAARARKRAPRGKREQQLLASIGAHPDYRVADHAREVGVKPQQLYPILNRLSTQEKIVKQDDRYALKSDT